MYLYQKCKTHLQENNMNYIQHFIFAFSHGSRCIQAGLLLVIHGIIPALFPKAGSKLVNKLNESFTDHNEYMQLKVKMEAFKNIYRSS